MTSKLAQWKRSCCIQCDSTKHLLEVSFNKRIARGWLFEKKKRDISTSSVFEMLVLRWISKTWKGGIRNILICEIGVATLIEEVWKRITIIEGLVISNEESARERKSNRNKNYGAYLKNHIWMNKFTFSFRRKFVQCNWTCSFWQNGGTIKEWSSQSQLLGT